MKVLIYVICLFFSVFTVQAEPLYLEQIKSSEADEKALHEAHKQIKDHSEIILKEDLFVSPFHKQNESKATDKDAFCSTCHQQRPHRSDERKRSFLNMHSRYISCETCHFKPKTFQLEYRWLDFNENSNEVPAKRITPFYDKEAVLILSDHELAEQARETWNKKSSIEKAKLKLRLHAPLSKEGPECLDCHNNKDQLLDLESLDYSKKEITKLQQHSIPRFFSRFTKEGQRLRMSDLLQ